MKTGQKMAIFTGECLHSFHFPCIAAHVRKHSRLVCPVCSTTWKDAPLLAIHKIQQNHPQHEEEKREKLIRPKICQKEEIIIKYQKPQQNIKHLTYNDDEPLLLSPTFSGGFIPIPEENETEEIEDEVDEFKGFFVNPISSSNIYESITNSKGVEVKLLPEVAIVSVGRTHEAYAVVLKLKAPPPPEPAVHNSSAAHFTDPARRAPIDLVTVLDMGGSMTRAKIQMLKRAMRLVISSLGSADRLSIIAFSATPKRLLPLKRMTVLGQRSARRIIDRLEISQGSCAGDALRKATKILEDRRERNPVASVMLLSDGQDERAQDENPNQRPSSKHLSSTRFAHVEIPVNSSGFGKKAGYSQEPAEDAFAKCVGGLLSVVVQDLRIQVGFASGSDPGEISAVYLCNLRPTVLSSGMVRVGDLYAEEETELFLELRVPVSGVGSHHVLSVRCSYKDPATREVMYGTHQSLLVPRPQAVRSSGPKIERLRNLFVTTRAIAESRRLIEHNELHSAQQLLASTRALLLQSSTTALADEYICGLEAELAEIQWRRQYEQHLDQQQMMMMMPRGRVNEREIVSGVMVDENGEPLTPTSAWRAAERLAKVATVKKSMNSRVSDLHGFENARF